MKKSKFKRAKNKKQHRLNDIVDKLYPGKKLEYKDLRQLQRQDIVPCGYLRTIHYDGSSFYGHCALENKDCEYRHNKPEHVCEPYVKRYGK